jgi:membrane protease YdiL (CAAX protease family)
MGYAFFFLALVASMIGLEIAQWITGPPIEVDGVVVPDSKLRVSTIQSLVIYGFMGITLLAMPGWWVARSPGQEDHRPHVVVSMGFGLLGLVFFFPIVSAVIEFGSVVNWWMTGDVLPDLAHKGLQLLDEATSSTWRWIFVAMVVLVVPVIEEVMYRGLLQESLRRHRLLTGGSSWAAIVASSFIFTLMHIAVVPHGVALLGLFVLSLGFGWVFARTGRLIASIVMHASFNALNLLLWALI